MQEDILARVAMVLHQRRMMGVGGLGSDEIGGETVVPENCNVSNYFVITPFRTRNATLNMVPAGDVIIGHVVGRVFPFLISTVVKGFIVCV